MVLVTVYGACLLLAVLLSGVAARTVLSTSLIVLVAGALVGPGGLGLVDVEPTDPIEALVADVALFTVLFTDGQRIGLKALRGAWRLSGRALFLGMPLTFLGVALLAHYIAGLSWIAALLVGAILSPTDPVFASAIVGRKDVPRRLRQLLNVESGLNDGLALPVVLLLLGVAQGDETDTAGLLFELGAGIVLGIVTPLAVAALLRLPFFGPEPRWQPLGPLAIGILIYGVAHLTHANQYLAAFAAGSALATTMPAASESFEELGDTLSELTKLVALLLFGVLLTPDVLDRLTFGAWVVAILALVLVRPVALGLSLARTPMPPIERAAAAWFGPKGFASVVYGLLVLQSGIPEAQEVFDLVALCIASSIALHSSTDVPIARLFHTEEAAELARSTSGTSLPPLVDIHRRSVPPPTDMEDPPEPDEPDEVPRPSH